MAQINVSRLKSGGREPRASSRTVARLADGVYRYADYENMLPLLCELCETEEATAEKLVGALIELYAADRRTTALALGALADSLC